MRLVYEPILPKEYTRLEYLESTGAQYILTGFTPTVNTDFELELSSTKTSTNWAMGCPTWVGVHYKGVDGQIGVTNSSTSDFQQYVNYARDNTRITMKLQGNTVYANGVSLGTITRRDGTLDFALFGYRDANRGATLFFSGSIYKCKLWDNGTLVRDFYPALRNSDSEPGMYDIVSGTFYTNTGTGTFNYTLPKEDDNIIDNPKYQQVEYLESDGNQYIDTGVLGNGEFDVDYIYNQSVDSSNAIFAGTRSSTQHLNFGQRSNGNTGSFSLAYLNTFWAGAPTTQRPAINTDVRVQISYKNGSQTGSLNGVAMNGNTLTGTEETNLSIYVFKRHHYGTDDVSGLVGKLYYFKLWQNGVLVRYFVPAIRKVDGKPGMFDKVSGNFYTNQGTGEFTTGAKIKQLPDAYEKLYYIETKNQQNNALSTNNAAYIDTGIIPNTTTKFECKAQFTTLISGNSNEALFGTTGINSSDPARMAFGFASVSPYTNFYMGLGTQNLTTSVTRDTNAHTFTVDASTSSWKIDDATGTFSNPGVVSGLASLYLFARNYAAYDYANKPANAKVYYCKIWQNNTIVRDLVPALRKADNKPGMYDFVSGQFFTNVGSGEFTYEYPAKPLGNSKLRIIQTGGYTIYDDLYKEVEYLESTGNQYIDTDFKPNNNTKIDLIGKFNTTYPACLWATRWSGSPDYDTYGAYAENNSAGMLYVYCGKYSGGNFTGVDNATFPHRDGNYIRFIQDKNKVDFTNLGTGANWTYTFNEETFQSTRNLALFYFSSPSAFNTKGGYIKSCKIWDNGSLVRDFVPVIRMSDNKPGMYDKKNKVFYTNVGTGEFIYPTPTLTKPLVTRYIAGGYVASIYKPLQYLQSSGAQYIDTGWTPVSNDLRVKFKTTSVGAPNKTAICGAENRDVVPRWVFIMYGQSADARKTYPLTGDWNNNDKGFTFTSGSVLEIDWTTSSTSTTITDSVSGTTYTYDFGSTINYSNNDITLKLFQNADNQKSSIQINYYKIWDGGVLVRDFIPVLRTLDNKPGMYDKVTGQFFTNQGTGEFSYA